jgi:triosephosphate isomerase
MPRPKIIAGNWKMYTTHASAVELARGVVAGKTAGQNTRVVLCPPFPWLSAVAQTIAGSPVQLGAQDCSSIQKEGAYTGQVSAEMLVDAGCQYVIIGHNERRYGLNESLDMLRDKVRCAFNAGLHVIFCMGETLPMRQANQTESVLDTHMQSLHGQDIGKFNRLLIAYEPVWAIGTGHAATPDQVQETHAFIRKRLGTLPGSSENLASTIPILYGGSVNPGNGSALLSLPDVDGALVGGASLKADSFNAIVKAAGN